MLPMRGVAPALLTFIWMAPTAISSTLLWPGRFDRTAVGVYLAMGWSCLFAMRPIIAALAPVTLGLLAAGGVFYSIGVIFHAWTSLRFQNAIWHGFVLAAASCHYAAVLTSLTD